MNNIYIFLLCCVVLCVLGVIRGFTCGGDAQQPSTCNNVFGGIGFIICCGSIILMLSK
jgi:hypothetical protein